MLRPRLLLFSLALPAAALALAACGGSTPGKKSSGPSPEAKQAVADATAKTKRLSMHVDVSLVLRKPGASNSLVYGATGNFSPSGGTFEIDRRSVGGSLQKEVVQRKDGHLVLYTNPTALVLPKGKTWLQVDMTKYALERYGANTAFLAGADQDPVEALNLAISPAAKVTDLGLDWLPDRTLNTHYRAKVDVIAVAKGEGVKGKGLQTLLADMGRQKQTIDVWVSKQGRVARVMVHNPVKETDGTILQQQSIADFSKFGLKAPLVLPPAKKVADYFELAAR